MATSQAMKGSARCALWGAAASVGPVNSGCCDDDEVGTEQEESKGVSGPVSLSAITCSHMTVLYFPIPRELLSVDSHNLEHTEKDALGNSSPASDRSSWYTEVK